MAGPRMSRKGNPAATYTNETRRLTNIKTPRRDPSHRYRCGSGVATASSDELLVSRCNTHSYCMDNRQAAAPHSGYFLRPQQPIVSSVGTRGVGVFNCGAPSALCMVDILEAARLTVNPL